MKKTFLVLSICMVSLLGIYSCKKTDTWLNLPAIPKGWHLAGRTPENYRFQNLSVNLTGKATEILQIESKRFASVQSTSGLLQTIYMDHLHNARVDLSADIQTEGLTGNVQPVLIAYDGSTVTAIATTTIRDTGGIWQSTRVEMNIPANGDALVLGFKICGKGIIRIANVHFQHFETNKQKLVTIKTPASNQTNTDVVLGGKNDWIQGGDKYDISSVIDNTQSNQTATRITFDVAMASLKKVIDATGYRASRIRLSTNLMSTHMKGQAHMWIGSYMGDRMIAYNEIRLDHIQGLLPKAKYQVDFEVPHRSTALKYGLTFKGKGTLNIGDMTISKIPTADALSMEYDIGSEPKNLALTQIAPLTFVAYQ